MFNIVGYLCSRQLYRCFPSKVDVWSLHHQCTPAFLNCQDLFLYSQVCIFGNPNTSSKAYDVSRHLANCKGIDLVVRDAFNKFPDFFVQAFKIDVDSWKFSMLLLYILWDDWPIFMISGSNEQLHQELEYILLKSDCHSWWISKIQFDTLEERYAIKSRFKLGKKGQRNVWNASNYFSTILHESSMSFWVAKEIQGRHGVCEGRWEVWDE